MNDHFSKNQIIAMEQSDRKYIRVKKIYVDMVNNLQAGMVLSEVFYWHLPNKVTGKSRLRTIPGVPDQWLACRRQSWWERSRLTPREFDRALEKLIAAKLLFKEHMDYKGQETLHVRINWPIFEQEYNRAIENQTPKAKKRRVVLKGLPDVWDFLFQILSLEVSPIGNTPSPIGNALSPVGEPESPVGDTYTTIETTTDTTTIQQDSSAPIGTEAALEEKVSPEEAPSILPDAVEQALQHLEETEKVTSTRKRDLLFDAVCEHVFEIDPNIVGQEGGRIGPIASWLSGKSEGMKRAGGKVGFISGPAEPAHVKQFVAAYKREHPNTNLPLDFVKFVEAWRKWASAIAKKPVIKPVVATSDKERTPEEIEELTMARKSIRPAWEGVGAK